MKLLLCVSFSLNFVYILKKIIGKWKVSEIICSPYWESYIISNEKQIFELLMPLVFLFLY